MDDSRVTVQLDLTQSFEEMADVVMETIAVPRQSLVHGSYSLAYVINPWVDSMWRSIRRSLQEHELDESRWVSVRNALLLQAWEQVIKDVFQRDVRVVEKEKTNATQ